MIVSAYPLFQYVGMIGTVIWIVFAIFTMITALYIEKLKKQYDIQTYKEIVSFYENKPLSRDEKNKEIGKRFYQKFFLAFISAVIALLVMIIMSIILG